MCIFFTIGKLINNYLMIKYICLNVDIEWFS